jgi:hypothetical protein
MSTPLSYCPTCKTYRPAVEALGEQRSSHVRVLGYLCGWCGTPVALPTMPHYQPATEEDEQP